MGRVWRLTDSSQCALAPILDVCRPMKTMKNRVGYTGEQGGRQRLSSSRLPTFTAVATSDSLAHNGTVADMLGICRGAINLCGTFCRQGEADVGLHRVIRMANLGM